MTFVAAASHAASSSLCGSTPDNTSGGHDEIVQLQKECNVGPQPDIHRSVFLGLSFTSPIDLAKNVMIH